MEQSRAFYTKQGERTEPGVWGELFDALPGEMLSICRNIKGLLLHPAKISEWPELEGLDSEDSAVLTVKEMLAALLEKHDAPLNVERVPLERLRVSCRHHALLLTSILRHRGIPARVRVGFAGYLAPPGMDFWCDHWICEAWDEQTGRWIRTDPDIILTDLDNSLFRSAGDVWLSVRRGVEDPGRFGVVRWWGFDYIKANLLHDMSCLLGMEQIYWEGPILARTPYECLGADDLALLDQLAECLTEPEPDLGRLRRMAEDPRLGQIEEYDRYR